MSAHTCLRVPDGEIGILQLGSVGTLETAIVVKQVEEEGAVALQRPLYR